RFSRDWSSDVCSSDLQALGIPYSVVDKQARIGGTWERNQFPESRVDTTSFVYQFSFMERYPWAEHYAPQEQVREYLEHVAEVSRSEERRVGKEGRPGE